MDRQPGRHGQESVPDIGLTVLVEPDQPALDIVLVHGFTGSPDKTWTHNRGEASQRADDGECSEPPPKVRKTYPSFLPRGSHAESTTRTAVFWPRDLLPTTIPNARVLTHGYDTHLRHKIIGRPLNKMTLNDIAKDLLVCLEARRRQEPLRPVLFVCHSLGGLVVKEMLRQACHCHDDQLQSVFESTVGIVFFGTPHRGADPRQLFQHIAERLARMAGLVANQDIINTLLPTPAPLRQLNDEFNEIAQRRQWRVFSFQEALGVKEFGGRQVVEDMSSYLGLGPLERTQHINSDHMYMCRFTGAEDTEYRKVADALRWMTAAVASRPKDDDGSFETLSKDQRAMLLASLRFEQIDSRFKSIRAAHAKTCGWFLQTREYLDWLDAKKSNHHHGFFWIKGKPGAGKSTLIKFVLSRFRTNPSRKIFFFFNARGAELERTTDGMYRSLLLQLLKPRPELHCAFDAAGFMAWNTTDENDWDIESLKRVFEAAVSRLDRSDSVTCFIDALDECDEDEIRDMVSFFERLAEYAMANHIKFKVIFSSRHYPHISISKSLHLVLERQIEHSRDIQEYVESTLRIDTGDDNDRQQILDRIQEKASGIFMWVVLVVDMLNKSNDRGCPVGHLQEKLRELPDNLHALFRDILVRDEECKNELLFCLQWVLFARRPLTPKELYYAIHAVTGPQYLLKSTPDRERVQRFIVNASKGLTEITTVNSVQFIHESVRDFLLKEQGLAALWADLGENLEGKSHDKLAECCLEYINLMDSWEPDQESISESPADQQSAAIGQEHPFLQYATDNILHHANAAAARGLVQGDLLSRFSLSRWVPLHNRFEKFKARQYDSEVTLLYVLAENNLAALIPAAHLLAPGKYCLDVEKDRFGTPLFAALATRSDEAALALMRAVAQAQPSVAELRDACELFRRRMGSSTSPWNRKFRFQSIPDVLSPIIRLPDTLNTPVNAFDQALSYAFSHALNTPDTIIASFILSSDLQAAQCNLEVLLSAIYWTDDTFVNVLLIHGADPEAADISCRTLLHHASRGGCETTVKALLKSGAKIGARDNIGRTPLGWAGSEAVARALVEGGANVHARDNAGQTPLSLAGSRDVAEALLQHGADIEEKDDGGRTPLRWAAQNGLVSVAELLIERGANVEAKDNEGWTPLCWAVQNRQVSVAKLLIERGEDVEAKDNEGRTPLCWAAQEGLVSVAELLIERGADIEAEDNRGWTPLYWALKGGLYGLVRALREKGAKKPLLVAADLGL